MDSKCVWRFLTASVINHSPSKCDTKHTISYFSGPTFMEQRVITLFHESIEAKMQAGESLAPHIVSASQLLVNALLNDNKIVTCGNGISAAQASIFTACLLNRFEHERP